MARPRTFAVLAAAAALSAGLPASALGQATPSNGSAASEYGDYVPTTSGSSSTTKHHSSPPRSTTHYTAPTRSYVPPARHYTAPTTTQAAPTTTHYSAPAQVAPTQRPHHKKRRHKPHHAAAVHKVAKPAPASPKAKVGVPAAPASSVDGGSGQLVLLGLAMLAMTVAVFTRAGLRRRHGSV
jgi:hypothetical protein